MTDSLLPILMLAGTLPSVSIPVSPPHTRDSAITAGLQRLEASRTKYVDHRQCYSCHHQAIPAFALSMARNQNRRIDEAGWTTHLELTLQFLRRDRERYERRTGPGGQADTAGSALWMLEVAGVRDDPIIEPIIDYLLVHDRTIGHWRSAFQRPPTQGSDFTTTYYAIRALKTFANPMQQPAARRRIAEAREWLSASRARTTEDRVFRLRALHWAEADRTIIRQASAELQATQRGDGGWAGDDALASDAYSTATALLALHEVGGLAGDAPAYRRGSAYLLRTQHADGSWHVRTRAKPIQPFFDSGFPHDRDQFISITSTAWAVAALMLVE